MITVAEILIKFRESLSVINAQIVAITGCKLIKTLTVVGFNFDKS